MSKRFCAAPSPVLIKVKFIYAVPLLFVMFVHVPLRVTVDELIYDAINAKAKTTERYFSTDMHLKAGYPNSFPWIA